MDWTKSGKGIKPKKDITVSELVDAGNCEGGYNLLNNNCTNSKERMIDRAGIDPKYGK
jgi:hypothetical protein